MTCLLTGPARPWSAVRVSKHNSLKHFSCQFSYRLRYHAAGNAPIASRFGLIGLLQSRAWSVVVGSDRIMKKHSRLEILLKLDQAAELARAGRSQLEVCKALGVSVMTFHRWRKLPMVAKAKVDAPTIVPEQLSRAEPLSVVEMARIVEELIVENGRLRKIVTDLLLEKMKLEESSVLPIGAPAKAMSDGV